MFPHLILLKKTLLVPRYLFYKACLRYKPKRISSTVDALEGQLSAQGETDPDKKHLTGVQPKVGLNKDTYVYL